MDLDYSKKLEDLPNPKKTGAVILLAATNTSEFTGYQITVPTKEQGNWNGMARV